jgi:branched-chain amino acid transport system substrate-binding protein
VAGTRLLVPRSFGGVLLVAAMLAGTACGQRPGVADRSGARRVAPHPGTPTAPLPAGDGSSLQAARGSAIDSSVLSASPTVRTGPVTSRSTTAATAGTVLGSTVSAGSVSAGSGRRPSGGSGPAARPEPGASEDRTGVTPTEIVVGAHGPITGAGPIPLAEVEKVKDISWKWLRDHGGIHGRNVRVVFRDDGYNPTKALQACREMVERDRAFLLVGFGVDQIAACAQYASEKGVPYVSAGGPEFGLERLNTYFALSMSYQAQAAMLVQLIMRSGKTKVGVVVENSPNHNDAYQSILAAARAAGLQIVRSSRISKNADQGQALAESAALRQAGAEVAFVVVSPMVFLNLAHAAQGQAYNPLWVGPGITNGINVVTEFGCPSMGAARFLSPFPQLDVIDHHDANYRVAYRKYNNGEEAGDFGIIAWGLQKTLHRMLEATGPDLTRQRFLATLESGREFASGVFPPVRYGPGRHFGANQAHLLEADCGQRRYRTLATFASAL